MTQGTPPRIQPPPGASAPPEAEANSALPGSTPPGAVARIFNLLYRGFGIRKPPAGSGGRRFVATPCRLQVGDTAESNSALPGRTSSGAGEFRGRSRGEPRASHGGLWAFLVLCGTVGLGALAWRFDLPLPRCAWRQITGIPCPFCGGTRSLMAWSQLDLAGAFFLNPLVFLLSCAAIVWFGLWLADRWRQQPVFPALRRRLDRAPVHWAVIALIVLNWAYLILARPN